MAEKEEKYPRVLARLVQLFDEQRLPICSLTFVQTGNEIDIRVDVEANETLAKRLEAKLWHQLDVKDVHLEIVLRPDLESAPMVRED